MEKEELFQIGEVSRLFHISAGILRHYDKLGLVRPEYTDPDTGYRYYSTRQFECLNTIRYLRALDMPLADIALFLENRDTDCIHSLLCKQKEAVARRRQELAAIERKIENRLNQLADALASELDTVAVVRKPARRLAALRRSVTPRGYLDLEDSIRELERDTEGSLIFLGKVGLGLSAEALAARRFQPYELVFLQLDAEDHFEGETIDLPPETCVTIRFQGGHERAPGYYDRLLRWIGENGRAVAGFSKEITMIDDGLTSDPAKFVTEIQIPVTPRRTQDENASSQMDVC